MTLEELASASGLSPEGVLEVQEYGLLSPSVVAAGTPYYDEEALTVATLVAGFARFSVTPRHLRLYRNAADREAGLVEQVVLPLLRQRNPEARGRAADTVAEMTRLGQGLHAALLRRAFRDLLGP